VINFPNAGLENARLYIVIAEVRAMLEVSSLSSPWAALIIVIRIVIWLILRFDSLNDLTVRPIPAA
jgi:hypothetical protein